MRDRPRKYPREWWIEDRHVYQRTISTIRSFRRTKDMYMSIIDLDAVASDGMPHGTVISDTTGSKAMRVERYMEELDAIEAAIMSVPSLYRAGVWAHCIDGKDFPTDADRKTYSKWKQCFIYHAAENLGLL